MLRGSREREGRQPDRGPDAKFGRTLRTELRLGIMTLGKAFLKISPMIRSITALNATTEEALAKKIERNMAEERRHT